MNIQIDKSRPPEKTNILNELVYSLKDGLVIFLCGKGLEKACTRIKN